MCYNWVLSIYDCWIITSLVEHTHVNSDNVGKVYGTGHCTFIRTDDHQVIRVNRKVWFCAKQCFHELIWRVETVESVKRDCILYTRIVGIKCEDIVYAHVNQFLKCQSAVQRLAFCTFVLTALIQKRHNNVKAVFLTISSGNQTFQILIVIVRWHVVHISVDGICQAVITYICHNKQVFSTDGFVQDTFCFTTSKTWAMCIYQIIVLKISCIHWWF